MHACSHFAESVGDHKGVVGLQRRTGAKHVRKAGGEGEGLHARAHQLRHEGLHAEVIEDGPMIVHRVGALERHALGLTPRFKVLDLPYGDMRGGRDENVAPQRSTIGVARQSSMIRASRGGSIK